MRDSKQQQANLYTILSDKLRQELEDVPPNEGEVFSILDFLIFSLENEEKSYLGTLGLRLSRSMLDMLIEVDHNLGRGPLRGILLWLQAPFLLARLLHRSKDIRRGLDDCTRMVHTIKRMQLVRFVEQSGGSFSTPVIQKWMNIRSFKISQADWNKLMVQNSDASILTDRQSTTSSP